MFTQFSLDEPTGWVRVLVGTLGARNSGLWYLVLVAGVHRSWNQARSEGWQGARQQWGSGSSPPSSPPSSWGLHVCLRGGLLVCPLHFCPLLFWGTAAFLDLCFPSFLYLGVSASPHLACVLRSVPLPWNPFTFCFCSYLNFHLAFLSSNSLKEGVIGLPHLSLQATSEPCVLALTIVHGERQPYQVWDDILLSAPNHRVGVLRVAPCPAENVAGADWLQSFIFDKVVEHYNILIFCFSLLVLVLLLCCNTYSSLVLHRSKSIKIFKN